jgi:ABC-type transporter Mla subunit MlaD
MALQDLTPQLRTRLSRVERAVGLFVTVATLLFVVGFGYYIYNTAKRKGWFLKKIEYQTSLNNAAGLKAGDPVKLMGFSVGTITDVKPNEPDAWYGVTVFFRILEPNYGYVWTDSKVRVAPADFLGNRYLEVLKGKTGVPTVLVTNRVPAALLDGDRVKQKLKERHDTLAKTIREENTGYTEHAVEMEANIQALADVNKLIPAQPDAFYTPLAKAKPYWIEPMESPALTERLETVVNTVEAALPSILKLTNQLAGVLTNAAGATANLQALLAQAQPIVTNLTAITDNIKNPNGSLGQWLIPTNINAPLERVLTSADATLKTANTTLASTDTNITLLISNLDKSLENLASLTSNLNAQVQANTNMLSNISSTIVHSDEMVQGLKRHWLLRSAFKPDKTQKTNKPPMRLLSPKMK